MDRDTQPLGIDISEVDGFRRRFEHWLRIAPVFLHSIDINGRFVAVTDFWLTKMGYHREEIIGRSAAEILAPTSRHYAKTEVLPRLFRVGYVDNIEYQIIRKNGDVLDVILSSVVDKSGFSDLPETISVLVDITDCKRVEQKLSESEALHRELIEHQSELVSIARPDGTLMFVNSAYANQHHISQAEMIGRNLFDFVPVEARAALKEHFRFVANARRTIKRENQVVVPSGKQRWISWSNRAVVDQNGSVLAIHSVGHDIDDRVTAERRVKESEELYRLLADNSSDMVFRLDHNLVRQYVSPACRELLGYEPHELIGGNPGGLAHPEDAPRLAGALRGLLENTVDREAIVYRVKHRDGRWIWVEGNAKAVRNPVTGETEGLIGALRDISARKAVEEQLAEANRQLQELALVDALTGLANRRAFNISFEREFNRAKRDSHGLVLIMIDVDHFKLFNDRYGHQEGDECLRRVARVLQTSARRQGDIAARYGGEEFAVVLTNAGEAQASEIAQYIQTEVLKLGIQHAASEFGRVSISLGIAIYEPSHIAIETDALIRIADAALYHAKAKGRNRFITSIA